MKYKAISLEFATSQPQYQLEIQKIYKSSENFIVISQLSHTEKGKESKESTVKASVFIKVTDEEQYLPLLHYIILQENIAKSEVPKPYHDIDKLDEIDLQQATLVPLKANSTLFRIQQGTTTKLELLTSCNSCGTM